MKKSYLRKIILSKKYQILLWHNVIYKLKIFFNDDDHFQI
jgi:hypothetical protein